MGLAGGLIPVAVFLWIIAGSIGQVNKGSIGRQLEWQAEMSARQVAAGLKQWSSLISTLSETPALESGDAGLILELLEETVAAVPGLSFMAAYRPDGSVHSVDRNMPGHHLDVSSLLERVPYVEEAWERAYEGGFRQVSWLRPFHGGDGHSTELLAIASYTADDESSLSGLLVAQFDLHELFKDLGLVTLPSGLQINSYLMSEPGFLMGESPELHELEVAVAEAGLTGSLWETIGETVSLDLSGVPVLMQSRHVDLDSIGMRGVSYSVVAVAGVGTMADSVADALSAYWPVLIAALGFTLFTAWLQHLRVILVSRPVMNGLVRFSKGDYSRPITPTGFDNKLDALIEMLNALALESNASVQRLEQLLQGLPLPILVESGGSVSFMNRCFKTEFLSERAPQASPAALHDVLVLAGFAPSAIKAIEQYENRASLQVVRDYEGAQSTFGFHLVKITQPGSDQAASVLAFWDLTEELALVRMKSELLATTAHELRTPLSLINGYAELMVSGRVFSDEQRDEINNSILQNGRMLQRMVADMLDLDRIERGQPLPLALKEFDLVPFIRERSNGWSVLYHEHHFNMELPDEPVLVYADEARILQVIANFGSNAVKFSEPGSSIGFRLEATDDEFSLFCVDQGIGMTREQLAHIFEPFYRVDNSSKAPQGSGLGLAVTKSILDACGGRIDIQSTRGEGTKVHVTMPRRWASDPGPSQ